MTQQPFSNEFVQRVMLAVIIVLALAAGYYMTAHGYEVKRNRRLQQQIQILENIATDL